MNSQEAVRRLVLSGRLTALGGAGLLVVLFVIASLGVPEARIFFTVFIGPAWVFFFSGLGILLVGWVLRGLVE